MEAPPPLLHILDPNYPSFYLKCPIKCQKTYNFDILEKPLRVGLVKEGWTQSLHDLWILDIPLRLGQRTYQSDTHWNEFDTYYIKLVYLDSQTAYLW